MKQLLMPFFLLFILSQSALAVPKPEYCPDHRSIQAAGLSQLMFQGVEKKWAATQTNQKYKTKDSWYFMFGLVTANTAEEALQQANKDLQAPLHFHKGPYFNTLFGTYECDYRNDQGQGGAALVIPANIPNHFNFKP